jgi:hypothetical protein
MPLSGKGFLGAILSVVYNTTAIQHVLRSLILKKTMMSTNLFLLRTTLEVVHNTTFRPA